MGVYIHGFSVDILLTSPFLLQGAFRWFISSIVTWYSLVWILLVDFGFYYSKYFFLIFFYFVLFFKDWIMEDGVFPFPLAFFMYYGIHFFAFLYNVFGRKHPLYLHFSVIILGNLPLRCGNFSWQLMFFVCARVVGWLIYGCILGWNLQCF